MRVSWLVMMAACGVESQSVNAPSDVVFQRTADTADSGLWLQAQCADPGFCGCDYIGYDLEAPVGDETCVHIGATVEGSFGAGSVIEDGASIDATAVLGAGSTLGFGSVIGPRAVVGDNVTIDANVVLARTVTVGDNTVIGADSFLGRSATLGDDVDASVGMLTMGYASSLGDRSDVLGTGVVFGNLATVGADSTIGADVVLARGASFGDFTTLGAGVVVGPEVSALDGVTLGAATRVRKGVTFADDVTVGENVRIGRDSELRQGANIANDAVLRTQVTVGTFYNVEEDAYIRRGTVLEDQAGSGSPFIADEPPVVVITSPTDGVDSNGGTLTITGTVSDDFGVNALAIQIDGGSWVSIPVTGGTFSHTLTSIPDQSNSIQVIATDTAGQTGADRVFVNDCSPSVAISHTWTGAVSTSWDTPGNWSAGTVPGPSSTAFVCGNTANQPVLDQNVQLASLYMGLDGNVDSAGLQLRISSRLSGGEVSGTGEVMMAGGYIRSRVPSLRIQGDVYADGYVHVRQDVSFTLATGRFRINKGEVVVEGAFNQYVAGSTYGAYMINTEGLLTLNGDTTLNGYGDAHGNNFSQGRVQLRGDLNIPCNGSVECFRATGTEFIFDGDAPQTVTVASSAVNDNYFHDVTVSNQTGVTMSVVGGDLSVNGRLHVRNGGSLLVNRMRVNGSTNNQLDGAAQFTSTEFMRFNHDVQVLDSSSLTVNVLETGGYFNMSPTSLMSGTRVDMYGELIIPSNAYTVATTRVTGDLYVRDDWNHTIPRLEINATYRLRIGEHHMRLTGDFAQNVQGSTYGLYMIDPAGRFDIRGNATFNGTGDMHDNNLSQGVVAIDGDLSVPCNGSVECFRTIGTQFEFDGDQPQTVTIASMSTTDNFFHDVVVSNPAGVSMVAQSGVLAANGNLSVVDGGVVSMNGMDVIGAGTNVFRDNARVTSTRTLNMAGTTNVLDTSEVHVDILSTGSYFNMDASTRLTGNRVDLRSELIIPSDHYEALTTRVVGDVFVRDDWDHTMPRLEVNDTFRLRIESHNVRLNGDFSQVPNGSTYGLYMINADGQFRVTGSATFNGTGDMHGNNLSQGVVRLEGDVSIPCNGSVECFIATGTRFEFDGTTPQTVTLASSTTTDNRFHDVVIRNSAGVTMSATSGVPSATGTLSVVDGGHFITGGFTSIGAGANVVSNDSVIESTGTLAWTGPVSVLDTSEVHVDVLTTGSTFVMDPTSHLTGNRVDMLTQLIIPSDDYQAVTTRVLGNLTVQGDWDHTIPKLEINSTFRLNLGAHTMRLDGDFSQVPNGSTYGLFLTNPAAQFRVTGDAHFGGTGDMSTSNLAQGAVFLEGDLTVPCNGSVECFIVSGTRFEFDGTNAQTVTLASSTTTDNRFHDVVVRNPAGVTVSAASGVPSGTGTLSVLDGGQLTTGGYTSAGTGASVVSGNAIVQSTGTLAWTGPVSVLDTSEIHVDILRTGSYFDMAPTSRLTGNRVDMLGELIVPSDDYQALITRVEGDLYVRDDWDHTLPRLEILGTKRLRIGAWDMTLDGDFLQNINGSTYGLYFNTDGGDMHITGDVTFNGTGDLSAGNFGSGTLRIDGDVSVPCNGSVECLRMSGTQVTLGGTGAQTLHMASTAISDNYFSGITIGANSNTTFTSSVYMGNDLTVLGTLTNVSGATADTFGDLTVTGSVNNQGTLRYNGSFNNGTVAPNAPVNY